MQNHTKCYANVAAKQDTVMARLKTYAIAEKIVSHQVQPCAKMFVISLVREVLSGLVGGPLAVLG